MGERPCVSAEELGPGNAMTVPRAGGLLGPLTRGRSPVLNWSDSCIRHC